MLSTAEIKYYFHGMTTVQTATPIKNCRFLLNKNFTVCMRFLIAVKTKYMLSILCTLCQTIDVLHFRVSRVRFRVVWLALGSVLVFSFQCEGAGLITSFGIWTNIKPTVNHSTEHTNSIGNHTRYHNSTSMKHVARHMGLAVIVKWIY